MRSNIMTVDEVFKIFQAQVQDVVPGLSKVPLKADVSLAYMQVSSIDRAQILIQTLEVLDLHLPFSVTTKANNIGELCHIIVNGMNK